MNPLKLSAGDPLTLTLAADARLCQTDYLDDQIWELQLGGGEPQAVALETTYGLRAHRMRLFPRFIRNGADITDPLAFFQFPSVTAVYPNYLSISFMPFEGLDVQAEYWVPEPRAVAGRLRLTNHSILPLSFQLEWVALLTGRSRPGGLVPFHSGNVHALAGDSSYHQPVVLLADGVQVESGPYPILMLDQNIYPGSSHTIHWACAGYKEAAQSLECASRLLNCPWDAEVSRIEMINSSHLVEVESGNPAWDAAFALAQRSALSLLIQNPVNLPWPSFVLTRRPDQGFSERGDGKDFPLTWSGQTALDSLYLASLIPGATYLAQGLVLNALSTQTEDGRIDWRPGLGGQLTFRRAQPVLTHLALRAAPPGDEIDWYQRVYPALLRFYKEWTKAQAFPFWENSLQSGIDDSPIFERFSHDARGVEPSHIITPGLEAMLLNECRSLIIMAEALRASEDLIFLHTSEASLQAALSKTWDETSGMYRYQDATTQLCLPSTSIVTFQGSGVFPTKRRFKQPRRLVIHLERYEEHTFNSIFTITGFSPQGEVVETLSPRNFAWLGKQAYASTDNTFIAVEKVEVEGLNERDRVKISTANFNIVDCSLLLPLWAGAPNPERARRLVETNLLTRFWLPFGIPTSPGQVDSVSLPWNCLIAEGLLRFGYRDQAADLLTRLMNAIVPNLSAQRSFLQTHSAVTGQPGGEKGHLYGLAPIGLFLRIIGIQSINPNQIDIDGFNPFPHPITIKYRKIELTCFASRTEIVFPAGQKVVIDRPGLHRVVLSCS